MSSHQPASFLPGRCGENTDSRGTPCLLGIMDLALLSFPGIALSYGAQLIGEIIRISWADARPRLTKVLYPTLTWSTRRLTLKIGVCHVSIRAYTVLNLMTHLNGVVLQIRSNAGGFTFAK
ncbi:hypothetical protein BJV78DRAFT_207334 [Lactifluus subvellereus]|nr:hypothetical protein BJV78DRAFT_207334 [Lactifluus subvellereus]